MGCQPNHIVAGTVRTDSFGVINCHGRYAIFQMAEVAIPRRVFAAILTMINALRGPPRSGAFV